MAKMPTRIDPENLNAKDVGISEVCKYMCTSTGCSSQKDFSKDRRNAFFVMVIKLFFVAQVSRVEHRMRCSGPCAMRSHMTVLRRVVPMFMLVQTI